MAKHDELRQEALERIKAQLEAGASAELPQWLRDLIGAWRCALHPNARADASINLEHNALVLTCSGCGQELHLSPLVRVEEFEFPLMAVEPPGPVPVVAWRCTPPMTVDDVRREVDAMQKMASERAKMRAAEILESFDLVQAVGDERGRGPVEVLAAELDRFAAEAVAQDRARAKP